MEHKFEPFQKVLVRQQDDFYWQAGLYSNYSIGTVGEHKCVGGICWSQCIPYEGNEHLLGTTNNPEPKHEYKYGEVIEVKCGDGVWRKGIVYACDGDGTKENGIVKFMIGSTLIGHTSANENFEIRPLAEDK